MQFRTKIVFVSLHQGLQPLLRKDVLPGRRVVSTVKVAITSLVLLMLRDGEGQLQEISSSISVIEHKLGYYSGCFNVNGSREA